MRIASSAWWLWAVVSLPACNAILDNEEPRHRAAFDGSSDGLSFDDRSMGSDTSRGDAVIDAPSDVALADNRVTETGISDTPLDPGRPDGGDASDDRGTVGDVDGSAPDVPMRDDGSSDVDGGSRPDVPIDVSSADADGGARDADVRTDEGGGPPPIEGGLDVVDASCTNPTTCTPDAPRLTAPLSTGRVTSNRPTLHWRAAAKAASYRVDLCADQACATVRESMTSTTTTARPVSALPTGPTYWRVVAENGAFSTPSATWEFFVGAGSAAFVDTSWLGPPDFNGDTRIDVAIGSGSAQAFLMMNHPTNGLPTVPSQTLSGAASFGLSMAHAGDVNGDGKSDLLVGTFASGLASVFLGNATGVDANSLTVGPGNSNFGATVGGAGDLNGDGYADIVAGGTFSGAATSSVYLGTATGISATAWVTGLAGSPAMGAGDVNGDGFSDVIACSTLSGTTIYTFNASGIFQSNVVPTPTGETATFGESCIGVGDVNGDGYADVAVTTSGLSNAYVFYGSASGLQLTGYAKLPGGSGGGFSGSIHSIAPAGDVNADGYDDVIVGAYNANRVLVYHGGAGGISTVAATSFDTLAANAQWGNFVAAAGDANGDGYADIGFASGQCTGFDVYVFPGSSSGVTTSSSIRTWSNPTGVQCFSVLAR